MKDSPRRKSERRRKRDEGGRIEDTSGCATPVATLNLDDLMATRGHKSEQSDDRKQDEREKRKRRTGRRQSKKRDAEAEKLERTERTSPPDRRGAKERRTSGEEVKDAGREGRGRRASQRKGRSTASKAEKGTQSSQAQSSAADGRVTSDGDWREDIAVDADSEVEADGEGGGDSMGMGEMQRLLLQMGRTFSLTTNETALQRIEAEKAKVEILRAKLDAAQDCVTEANRHMCQLVDQCNRTQERASAAEKSLAEKQGEIEKLSAALARVTRSLSSAEAERDALMSLRDCGVVASAGSVHHTPTMSTTGRWIDGALGSGGAISRQLSMPNVRVALPSSLSAGRPAAAPATAPATAGSAVGSGLQQQERQEESSQQCGDAAEHSDTLAERTRQESREVFRSEREARRKDRATFQRVLASKDADLVKLRVALQMKTNEMKRLQSSSRRSKQEGGATAGRASAVRAAGGTGARIRGDGRSGRGVSEESTQEHRRDSGRRFAESQEAKRLLQARLASVQQSVAASRHKTTTSEEEQAHVEAHPQQHAVGQARLRSGGAGGGVDGDVSVLVLASVAPSSSAAVALTG